VVVEFFGEGVSEAREMARSHPQGKVAAFDD
jgi:hypothetical protein